MEKEMLVEVVGEAIQKEFGQLNDLSQKNAGDIAELKTALEKISLTSKGTDEVVKHLKQQTFIVDLMRKAYSMDVRTEEKFKSLADAEFKAAFANEGIAGEGAEFVFSQFERNVINVMKEYPVVNEVKIYTTKGKDLLIPRATNTITTVWVGEGAGYTKSKPTSAFVTINVHKAACLVPFTDELMADNMTIPDLYEMIVRFIGESQGAFVENAILNGNGTQVDGLFNNSSVVVVTAPAGNVKFSDNTAAELDDLMNDLDAAVSMEYLKNEGNVIAIMSKYTFNVLRKAKNTVGAYMFPELRDKNPLLLGKYRILLSHKAPVQNSTQDVAGATPIVFGDLRNYYGMVRRSGLAITRGYADGDFENGLESIRAEQRFGGEPTIPEAFAKVKNAA
jgi:HK97 family phage major capsid protein